MVSPCYDPNYIPEDIKDEVISEYHKEHKCDYNTKDEDPKKKLEYLYYEKSQKENKILNKEDGITD